MSSPQRDFMWIKTTKGYADLEKAIIINKPHENRDMWYICFEAEDSYCEIDKSEIPKILAYIEKNRLK